MTQIYASLYSRYPRQITCNIQYNAFGAILSLYAQHSPRVHFAIGKQNAANAWIQATEDGIYGFGTLIDSTTIQSGIFGPVSCESSICVRSAVITHSRRPKSMTRRTFPPAAMSRMVDFSPTLKRTIRSRRISGTSSGEHRTERHSRPSWSTAENRWTPSGPRLNTMLSHSLQCSWWMRPERRLVGYPLTLCKLQQLARG